MYSVYLLKCSDGSLYCGIAKDLRKRMALHNKGMASKYTRARRPLKLVYSEIAQSKSHALKREFAIKKLPRLQKKMLAQENPGTAFCF